MAYIVVTGANRGVGLGLVQEYLSRGDTVIACARLPDEARCLMALADQFGDKLRLLALDVASQQSAERFAAEISHPIDVLIHNAGINGGPHQSLEYTDVQAWLDTINVMTIGPFRVTSALLSHLTKANGAKVAYISSQVASSAWGKSILAPEGYSNGGHYAYATAKAAGNKVMQILSIDLKGKGIVTGSIHPGAVITDMGRELGQIQPEESARGIARVIDHITSENSGRFWKWSGEELPV
jgi:NAD(P)-dependent dehydrogenase (short-subunit alcohol dehydrogenase family)